MHSHAVSRHPLTFAFALILAAALAWSAGSAKANARIGQPAPPFSGIDSQGRTHQLADYRGRTVILEWTNHDCPYVQKHYDSGNMQALQRAATADGAVWLTVISSAPGKQGHVSARQADALTRQRNAAPGAVILDESGAIGRAYGAKTTPHMYIIDARGTLVYMGGIDDRASTDPADIPGARNHVRAALDELKTGKPVSQASTRPYGCSVKY
jgi:peroxiredoxin